MPFKGVNEANLPNNSKFSLTEAEWNPTAASNNGGLKGIWVVPTDVTPNVFTSDATISESYSLAATAVKYPVEGGFPTSDLAGVIDFSVAIVGVNSNASMSLLDAITSPLDVLGSSFLGQQFSNSVSRVQRAYNTLEDWAKKGSPLFLRCAYAKDGYTDLNGDAATFVITSFAVSRDENTGDAIGYSLTLDQIYISRLVEEVGDALVTPITETGEQGANGGQINGKDQEIKELEDLSQKKVQSGTTALGKYSNSVTSP